MKNSDIAMIILVASISVVISYFLGNAILGDPNERVESISYMNKIDSNVQEPDIETFNSYALNPTVEVYVGNCGPLEEWNEAKHLCVPKDGLGDGDKSVDEDKDAQESDDTDKSDDSSDAGDE